MTGKPSAAMERARKAYEASGKTLTVVEMVKKYKLDRSTIHRSGWYEPKKRAVKP